MTANPFIRITDDIRKEIEVRAYLIWESEGRPFGRSHEHWQRAEAEVMAAHMLAAVAAAEKPKKAKAAPKKKTAKTAAKTTAPKAAEPKAVEHKAEAPAKTKAAAKTKRAAKPKTSKTKHKEA